MCYPDGSPDTRGRLGWNVGYPSQHNMTVDEADFLRALTADVAGNFNIDNSSVFLSGFSNGGDLCYQIAYTRPDMFRAYASVGGLTFTWMYLANSLSSPVPFLEIHGTADKTSMGRRPRQHRRMGSLPPRAHGRSRHCLQQQMHSLLRRPHVGM